MAAWISEVLNRLIAPLPWGVAFGTADSLPDAGSSTLQAWDPIKHEQVWEQPLPPQWNPGDNDNQREFGL